MPNHTHPLLADSDSPASGFALTVQESIPADASLPFADSALVSLPAELQLLTDGDPTIGHVGRYALKRLLGEGGLGTVHASWDPILSRAVAVKTLHLSRLGADRKSLDSLFLHEARAVAGLSHPHIVTVFDAGLDAQHGVYIAMEHLAGQDLRRLLSDGWLPSAAQAARLVRRVADALTYAHAMGVIHCDIKPANIFMVGQRRPKVLDFGIARVARQGAAAQALGPSAGSPQYAAPEQVHGGIADARTDVHALGLLLFELLTGRRAFEGQSLDQLTAAVTAPRSLTAHDLSPQVPPALSAIADRAMALDPAVRYPSASEMALALRRWSVQDNQARTLPSAVSSKPGSTSSSHGDPRRKPTVRWLLALALASTALGLLGWQLSSKLAPSKPTALTPGGAAAQATTPPAIPTLALLSIGQPSQARSEDTPTPVAPEPVPGPGPTPAKLALPIKPHLGRPVDKSLKTALATEDKPSATTAAVAVMVNGLLQLAISPWGQVEVDGKVVGITPPLGRLSLPEGEHTVVIRNDDFAAHSTTIRITADQPVVVRHRFGS